jgi:hypothetical protein
MAPYTEQVLLCTGKEDWASNLEDEEGATAEFVKGLKAVIGKGGEAFDVCTSTPYHTLDEKARADKLCHSHSRTS